MSISQRNCLWERDSRAHSNDPSSIFHEYFIGCQKEENKLVLSPYLCRQQHRCDFGGAHFSAQKILLGVSQFAHKKRHTGIKEGSTFYVFVVSSSSLEVSRHLMFFLLTLDGKVDVMAQRKREEKRHLPSFVASFLPLLPFVSECLGEIGARGGEDSRGPFFSALFLSRRREGGGRVPFFPSFPLSLSLSREGGKNTHSDGGGGKKREKNGLREGRSNTLSSSEMKVGLFVCTTPTQSPSSLSPGAASDASRNLLPPSSSSFSSGRRENGMEWGGEPVQSPERPQRGREKRALRHRRRRTAVCAPSVRPPPTDRQSRRPSVEGKRRFVYYSYDHCSYRSLAGGCGRTTEL